jgi:hypothetical protein
VPLRWCSGFDACTFGTPHFLFANEPKSHLCYPNLQHRAVRFGVSLAISSRAHARHVRALAIRARNASAANAHHDAPCVNGPSPAI